MTDDTLGRIVHFGCGSFLGFCFGIYLYSEFAPCSWAWVIIPAACVLAGLAATFWGDEFWEHIIRWLSWG
jgi:hypothetical protein